MYVSQVKRVEEQHDVFPFVVGERDVLELAIDDGGGLPLGRGLSQLQGHPVEAGNNRLAAVRTGSELIKAV